MEALAAIKTRRSTRRYKQTPVPPELLEQVLEAGRHAPSGGNNQSTHLLVIQNPAVLRQINRLARDEFRGMEVTPGMYRSMANAVRGSRSDDYCLYYHAPVLILTANRIDYPNNIADCACVLENMMVAANALDLGSCWINQLRWLNEAPVVTEYLNTLGLAEGERVYGGLSLGWPDTEDGLPQRVPLERTGNPVTMIGESFSV